jgi:hypothetical protein
MKTGSCSWSSLIVAMELPSHDSAVQMHLIRNVNIGRHCSLTEAYLTYMPFRKPDFFLTSNISQERNLLERPMSVSKYFGYQIYYRR